VAATARQEAQGQRPRGGSLYVGGAALAVLFLVGASWLWWSLRRPAVATDPGHSAATDTRSASSPLPSTDATPTPAAAAGGGQGFAGWADQESDLPQAELRRLRGVGAWTGDKLTITVYNASSWRVTEIVVRTSLMEADRFVDAVEPHRLSPAGAAPVDAAVGELLNRVAPNRKRAGVNPADTGPFEATVGPQPAGYRWRIEGARGYPPR
jgi:hypothetical protein